MPQRTQDFHFFNLVFILVPVIGHYLYAEQFQTCPLIEEQVLNATKNLLADEIIPEVNLKMVTEVATVETWLTQEVDGLKELISGLGKKVSVLEGSIDSKDTEIDQLKQRFEGFIDSKDTKIDQLEQQFGWLRRSIASKDNEINQLKQRFRGLEASIDSKDTEIHQLQQRFEGSIALKDIEIDHLKQRLNVRNNNTVIYTEQI